MTGSTNLYMSVLSLIIGHPIEEPMALTLLDLCCGEMTHTRLMKFQKSMHLDVHDWPGRPKEFVFFPFDVRTVQIAPKSYDVCLCSDGIEHLTKEEGLKLLDNMEQWSFLPIIFTPLGEQRLVPGSTDPDDHKSGWTPEEFEARGWETEVYESWHRDSPKWNCGAFFAWKPL